MPTPGHPGEKPLVVMLSAGELAELSRYAEECEMDPRYYAADLLKCALWDRRVPGSTVRRMEQEVLELRRRVVEMQRMLTARAAGEAQ